MSKSDIVIDKTSMANKGIPVLLYHSPLAILDRNQTAFLSILLFVITFSFLQLYSSVILQSEKLIIFAGFIGSILFFFALIALGNLRDEVKWIDGRFFF